MALNSFVDALAFLGDLQEPKKTLMMSGEEIDDSEPKGQRGEASKEMNNMVSGDSEDNSKLANSTAAIQIQDKKSATSTLVIQKVDVELLKTELNLSNNAAEKLLRSADGNISVAIQNFLRV